MLINKLSDRAMKIMESSGHTQLTEYSHVKAPAISARAPVPVTTSAPLKF